jgi:hypothetical protein
VSLQLRKPLVGGRTHLVFEPLQFLRRLAASIPGPRQNVLRFHGIFAPNASCRPAIAALVDSQQRSQSTATKTPLVPPHNAGTGGWAPLPSEQPQPVPKPYRRRYLASRSRRSRVANAPGRVSRLGSAGPGPSCWPTSWTSMS